MAIEFAMAVNLVPSGPKDALDLVLPALNIGACARCCPVHRSITFRVCHLIATRRGKLASLTQPPDSFSQGSLAGRMVTQLLYHFWFTVLRRSSKLVLATFTIHHSRASNPPD